MDGIPKLTYHYDVTPDVAGIAVGLLLAKPDGGTFAVVRREDGNRRLWMSRNSHDWLLNQLLKLEKTMTGDHAGRSLIEILWEQLDAQYAKLMDIHEDGKAYNQKRIAELLEHGKASPAVRAQYAEEVFTSVELRGKVAGLAYSIAKITSPYGEVKKAMDAVREEARERWEANLPEEDEEEDD